MRVVISFADVRTSTAALSCCFAFDNEPNRDTLPKIGAKTDESPDG